MARSDRFDVLRSLVRGAADRASDRLRDLAPLRAARRAVRDAIRQRASLSEETLSTSIAHAPGVRAASVSIREGRIWVDAGFDDGETIAIALEPLGARFAPRGAKEVLFRVEPADAAGKRQVREVVGALSEAIARALWAGLIPRQATTGGGLVEGRNEELRVDLRSVPAVRKLLSRGTLGMALDMLELRTVEAREGALKLELRLPHTLV